MIDDAGSPGIVLGETLSRAISVVPKLVDARALPAANASNDVKWKPT